MENLKKELLVLKLLEDYHDEIKNKRKKMNKLNEKYKLSFRPTISNKSVDLALKKREKMKLESEEKIKLKNKELDENN